VKKRWIIHHPDEQAQGRLIHELRISGPAAGALTARGIVNVEDARRFLRPRCEHIADFSLLPDADKALDRIHRAIRDKEPITIYADYDADGLCGAAIIGRFLGLCGYKAEVGGPRGDGSERSHGDALESGDSNLRFYVPHRISEGYGVHPEAIEQIARNGTKLLICVDCGIAAPEAIARAAAAGLDTVVLDHHEPGIELPPAYALVDPKRVGSLSPSSELTGSGLALKLVLGLLRRLFPISKRTEEKRCFIQDIFALAALGTIADVAPLLGENRPIVYYGLPSLRSTSLAGLKAMLATTVKDGAPLRSYDVAFKLAPRINAASRVDSPSRALDLLLTDSPDAAADMAAVLEKHNRSRQNEQRKSFEEALTLLDESAVAEMPVIVVARAGWNPGVVGLVAAKLVERFYRPSVAIAIEDGVGRGSARSIPGVNIHDAIKESSDLLTEFGGHASAAGLSIPERNIARFAKRLADSVARVMPVSEMRPALKLDGELMLAEVNATLAAEVASFEPFGEGNPEPLFAASDVQVQTPETMGSSGEHVTFDAVQGARRIRAVAFGCRHLYETLLKTKKCSIAFTPVASDYSHAVEIKVKDFQFEGE